MRIAIVSWSRRKFGGAETYLARVSGGLHQAGHEMALFCEVDTPESREPIGLPDDSPVWCVAKIGRERALIGLRDWHPDVIYGQGLVNSDLESATLQVAPAALFAHSYYGTCISGPKTFKYPTARPCNRRFGWQCLIHYYPHRCGGLNPATMWSDFRQQTHRIRIMASYRVIITASEHMRSEYLKHGFAPQQVKVIALPAQIPGFERETDQVAARAHRNFNAYKLLFAGRMDFVKGGDMLLDALPMVLKATGRTLEVTFVGDGPERGRWEGKASHLQSHEPNLRIHFTGWLEQHELHGLFSNSDLLVLPSLWPEPFGLVGVEAGLCGLPAVGFAVGGIPEWLLNGVNGYLAPGNPPTHTGLAEAVIECLRDCAAYGQLRIGALKMARRFDLGNHIGELTQLFEQVMVGCPQPTTTESPFVELQ